MLDGFAEFRAIQALVAKAFGSVGPRREAKLMHPESRQWSFRFPARFRRIEKIDIPRRSFHRQVEGPGEKPADFRMGIPVLKDTGILGEKSGGLGKGIGAVAAENRLPDRIDADAFVGKAGKDFVTKHGHAVVANGSGRGKQHQDADVPGILVELAAQ